MNTGPPSPTTTRVEGFKRGSRCPLGELWRIAGALGVKVFRKNKETLFFVC